MSKRILFLSFIVMVLSCKKHHNPQPAPGPAAYLTPTANQACTPSGFVNDSTGTVDFQWKMGNYADNYRITVTNLINGQPQSFTTRNLYLSIPLKLATPYSWNITSLQTSTGTQATSDTWKFYVAGKGISTYAPFPATLTAPTFGQMIPAGPATLTWTGSDVVPGKLTYSVYLDTLSTPGIFKENLSDAFISINVETGKTYYWRIITYDKVGNSSDSGVYQFSVN